jgi:hypothetical protein
MNAERLGPLPHAVTTSRPSITQELWRIRVNEVFSLQAAIFQEHFHRFFRGRDSMKRNTENRRFTLPGHRRRTLLHAVTTIQSFITQELWRIPVEEVLSLQAAIIQERFHRFFRGRDSMKAEQGESPLAFWAWPDSLLGDRQRFPPPTVDHRRALFLPSPSRPDNLSKIVPCLPLK